MVARATLLILTTSCLMAAAAAAQGVGSLELVGADGTSRTLTPAELSDLAQTEVTATEDGATHTFRGPTLRDLMTLVGAPAGRGLRGPAMTMALVAEASDGYVVGFMLSEVDPQFGNRTAIVALTQDGASLPEGDGPLRIVLPDDPFRARWVRQLARVRLVQVGGG